MTQHTNYQMFDEMNDLNDFDMETFYSDDTTTRPDVPSLDLDDILAAGQVLDWDNWIEDHSYEEEDRSSTAPSSQDVDPAETDTTVDTTTPGSSILDVEAPVHSAVGDLIRDIVENDALRELFPDIWVSDTPWQHEDFDLLLEPLQTQDILTELPTQDELVTPAEVKYRCRQRHCSEQFLCSADLRSHNERAHRRIHHCLVQGCGMSCPTPKDLKRHRKTHESTRPLHCPHTECEWFNKGFKRKDILLRHIQRFHA